MLVSKLKIREYLPTGWQNVIQKKILPITLLPIEDKVPYRRKLVLKLALDGLKQTEIAEKIHCSISTIEKDFRAIRCGEIYL